jgi:hypothetical protein
MSLVNGIGSVGTVEAADTVTVAVAVDVPAELLAVRVYVVVEVGLTTEDEPVTAAPLRAMLVAFRTVQASVLDAPLWIVAGVAVKESMEGAPGVPPSGAPPPDEPHPSRPSRPNRTTRRRETDHSMSCSSRTTLRRFPERGVPVAFEG